MRIAINLAKRGGSKVFPNPRVGAVVVRNGRIVGRGYHGYFGGPHAEINAIKAAGPASKGAVLYVTLEPCNHRGKTPPCTHAIVKAGIKRVVYASNDRKKRSMNGGGGFLAKKGIEITKNILKKESISLNRDYYHQGRLKPTRVILKSAMTLDGKIATYTGDSKWITSEEARSLGHDLRGQVDAVLVGINTVLADDPELTAHGRGRNPVRVVIDPGLRIPLSSKILNEKAPTVIIHRKSRLKAKLETLKKRKVYAVEVPGTAKISFKYIINKLNKIGLDRILIEGGGMTSYEAIASGTVDEVMFFVAPKIVGGREAKTPVEGPGISRISKAFSVFDISVRKIGPDILIKGRVRG